MRYIKTVEIRYSLRGETHTDSFNGVCARDAMRRLIARLKPRDKAFFRVLSVSII
jgi:hypothetical protein